MESSPLTFVTFTSKSVKGNHLLELGDGNPLLDGEPYNAEDAKKGSGRPKPLGQRIIVGVVPPLASFVTPFRGA